MSQAAQSAHRIVIVHNRCMESPLLRPASWSGRPDALPNSIGIVAFCDGPGEGSEGFLVAHPSARPWVVRGFHLLR